MLYRFKRTTIKRNLIFNYIVSFILEVKVKFARCVIRRGPDLRPGDCLPMIKVERRCEETNPMIWDYFCKVIIYMTLRCLLENKISFKVGIVESLIKQCFK
jgi:hypothetical protein